MRNVLLIDDHEFLRSGTAACLKGLNPAVQVFHASHCEEGIALAHQYPMDLVLLDIAFPNQSEDGLGALIRLKKIFESLCVVIHTGKDATRQLVAECIDKGAMGFIPKGSEPDFVEALQIVLSGRPYVPAFAMPFENTAEPTERLLPDLSNTRLTPRQREITEWLVRGVCYKDIAKALGIETQSVRNYTRPIFAEFGVKTRAELIFELVRRGWLKKVS